MLEKVKVPILGIVENMSGFTCPSCGEVTHIFHQGGASKIAATLDVPFLGAIPLDPAIVDSGDNGVPLAVIAPDSPAARAYGRIADTLMGDMAQTPGLQVPFDWHLDAGTGKPAPVSVEPRSATDRPLALDFGVTGLVIRWSAWTQTIDPRELRLACNCAACRDEVSGKRLLNPASVPLDVVPTRIWSVGNYAFGVAFSDGHDSGIYPLATLRGIESAEAEDV